MDINDKPEQINEDAPEKIIFGYECDLHCFHPKDTKAVINEFISQAVADNVKQIRLIHGKGKSVKKEIAQSLLKNHPDVLSFHNDGSNWGATIICLK